MFAGHGIEGETGGDFGDAPGAFGDDDEVDKDEDAKDDETHDVIAPDDEIAEGLDDVPGVTIQQDQTSRGNIQGKTVECNEQEQRGKTGEIRGRLDVKDNEQDEERECDADGEQPVEQERGDRQDHQEHRSEQSNRQEEIAVVEEAAQIGGAWWHARFR